MSREEQDKIDDAKSGHKGLGHLDQEPKVGARRVLIAYMRRSMYDGIPSNVMNLAGDSLTYRASTCSRSALCN